MRHRLGDGGPLFFSFLLPAVAAKLALRLRWSQGGPLGEDKRRKKNVTVNSYY